MTDPHEILSRTKEAELARLRSQVEPGHVAQLEAENAALRELVTWLLTQALTAHTETRINNVLAKIDG